MNEIDNLMCELNERCKNRGIEFVYNISDVTENETKIGTKIIMDMPNIERTEHVRVEHFYDITTLTNVDPRHYLNELFTKFYDLLKEGGYEI